MFVDASDSDSQKKFPSKSCLLGYGAAKIQEDALSSFKLRYVNTWGTASITKYFHGQQPSSSRKQSQDNLIEESSPLPPSGNENYSEVNVTTPQIEFPYKETRIKYAVPSLHQLEDKKDLLNEQNPCCSPKNPKNQAQDDFTQGSLLSSISGTELCLGENQGQLIKNDSREEPCLKAAMPGFNRQEQKRKTVKVKGTSSILRFFKNQDPSCAPRKLEHVENTEDIRLPLSVGPQSRSNSSLDHNQSELSKERPFEETGTSSAPSSAQFEQRRGVWSYNTDEIDPSVIDELPPEIEEEVRAWLRPHKRQNVVKRGSSIADYFLPTRNAVYDILL
ncbi:putative DNA-directed DNA polymerase [Rosa chinensis]|uniref:Putative DNA-directed DNA polymerase n=1 Tax=Rosa chinensis TaxID=74649 RepID=A0A2P6Q7H1_ROSCH|nr:putative DNA-directed DNA polymerase [Rosa chinensis]